LKSGVLEKKIFDVDEVIVIEGSVDILEILDCSKRVRKPKANDFLLPGQWSFRQARMGIDLDQTTFMPVLT
jgi:hypothetical protein